MNLPVDLLAEAEEDIDSAFQGYECVQAGLGERFLAELRQVSERVSTWPELYGIVEGNIRAATLNRFPQVVFYRVEANRVLVVGVIHGRRSWKVWQDRI